MVRVLGPRRGEGRGKASSMAITCISVREARARLNQIVREACEHDVILLMDGHPAAYLVGMENYAAVLARLQDAEDKIAAYEAEFVTTDYENLAGQLGLEADHQPADLG